MRKRIQYIFCVVACLGIATNCFPQSVRETMDANQAVFELVDSYIANANLTEGYAQKAGVFRSLFERPTTNVYMDHINWFNNANRKDTTNLENYCDFYSRQQGTFTQFGITDVHIDYRGALYGVMEYTVEMNKQYSLPGDDKPVVNPLVMHVSYDLSSKKAKITSIECTRPDSRMHPHISANYIKYDNALYIPKTLKVKNIDGSYIHLDERVRPLSTDVYARLSKKNCATYSYDFEAQSKPVQHHTISVSTVKNAVGIEVGYSQALGSNASAPTDHGRTFSAPSYRERALHIGAVYQRQLFARNRHRLSLETGVSFDLNWQRLYVDAYQESRDAVDTSGDSYTRLTSLDSIWENCRSMEFAVPLILRYDYFVTPNLSLFAAAGVRGSAFLFGVSNASFDAYYAGQYGPEYFNVYIDRNGYYDFGTYDVAAYDSSRAAVRWHLDALARVGAQYFFTADKRWSAELSVGMRYRLLDRPQVWLNDITDYSLSPDYKTFNSALRNLTLRPPLFIECQVKLLYNF